MKHKLIFVRHGIRGFPEPIPPVSSDPKALLLLASHENLSLVGHLLCYNLGKLIREKYGTPNFLYADVTTPRTVDSGISLGLAAGCTTLHLSNKDPDLFFQFPKTVTSETIAAEHQILHNNQKEIQEIRKACEEVQPSLELVKETLIDPKTGVVTGLVLQEYVLGSEMLFAEDSKIKSPLLRKKEVIEQIHPILWTLRGATRATIKAPAKVILRGVSQFLQTNKLSVLVGHEHNIIQVSQYLCKLFKTPEFPELWVPPVSGFIFSLHENYISIKIIYLTSDLKFKKIKYGQVKVFKPRFDPNLIARTINY